MSSCSQSLRRKIGGKRVTEQEVRLKCIRLAMRSIGDVPLMDVDLITDRAKSLEAYVLGTRSDAIQVKRGPGRPKKADTPQDPPIEG